MVANYDDERRFLASLGRSKGPFFIVGFETLEQDYILERAKEHLKSLGHHLDLAKKMEAGSPQALAHIQGGSLGLFDTQGWEVIDQLQALKKESLAAFVQAVQESPFRLILTSSKKLEGIWLQSFPEATVLDVSGEKPWDRPRRLSPWVQALVQSLGMQIDTRPANLLCESLQNDRQMIKTKVQALAASQGYKGPLKVETGELDVSAQVWKWLDQVWNGHVASAFLQIPLLLEEDASAISLLALVRQQWHAFMLAAEGEGSRGPIAGAYGRNQQKAQRARAIGYKGLCEGAQLIAKAQWDLKSSREPSEVLQLLIVRLSVLCNPRAPQAQAPMSGSLA